MPPSFFKILLDPSAPHLQLPPDFVSLHLKNKIPNSPIIRSANGGYSWRLKIKQIGDSYCFTNGWKNVVEDIHMGFADFIYFQLFDQSTFKMSIYSPNGCEKILPHKVEYDSGGVDEDLAGGFEIVVEEDDENDDEDEEDDDNDYNGNYENNSDNDDDEKNEGNGDDEDDNPFFVSIITKAHKRLLRFPVGFAELIGVKAEGNMTLKNLDGKEWVAGLRLDKAYRSTIRYYLSPNWRVFLRENDLSEGDECVFKFIRSEGKLLLAKVTKGRWFASQPPSFSHVKDDVKRVSQRGANECGGDVDIEVMIGRLNAT